MDSSKSSVQKLHKKISGFKKELPINIVTIKETSDLIMKEAAIYKTPNNCFNINKEGAIDLTALYDLTTKTFNKCKEIDNSNNEVKKQNYEGQEILSGVKYDVRKYYVFNELLEKYYLTQRSLMDTLKELEDKTKNASTEDNSKVSSPSTDSLFSFANDFQSNQLVTSSPVYDKSKENQ